MTPNAVLRGADEKRIKLVFATRMNLVKLARSMTVADALAAAREAPVVTVTPVIERTSAGPFIHIPEAAGYGGTPFSPRDIPRPSAPGPNTITGGKFPPDFHFFFCVAPTPAPPLPPRLPPP